MGWPFQFHSILNFKVCWCVPPMRGESLTPGLPHDIHKNVWWWPFWRGCLSELGVTKDHTGVKSEKLSKMMRYKPNCWYVHKNVSPCTAIFSKSGYLSFLESCLNYPVVHVVCTSTTRRLVDVQSPFAMCLYVEGVILAGYSSGMIIVQGISASESLCGG